MNTKKLAIAALSLVLAVATLGVPAAEASPWDPVLTCTPSYQYTQNGVSVSFSAYGGDGSYSWTASGGSPSTGWGPWFSTVFYVSGISELRTVTVVSGGQAATCSVTVSGSGTWTPTPTPMSSVSCAPTWSYVQSNQDVTVSAYGGNGSYSWSAPDGVMTSGWGQSFTTRFANYTGSTINRTITVTSAGTSATCNVNVYGAWTPTPSPAPYAGLTHRVRNISANGSEATSVWATQGQTLEFVSYIATGNQYLNNARIGTWLPSGLAYVPGSTWTDAPASDDASDGTVYLGNLSPNRTYTLRFRATVNAYSYNSVLTQTATLSGDSLTSTSQSVTVQIGNGTIDDQNRALTIAQTIRNVTAGQAEEHTSVRAQGSDTLLFTLRVRNQTTSTLTNVVVTDVLPASVRYVASSTTLNGATITDGVVSSGLSIGSLTSGQEAIVKFSAIVDGAYVPTTGIVWTTSTATARAYGTADASAKLPIGLSLNRASVIGSAGNVQTGPGDSVLLALLIAIATTLGYALYAQSGTFRRRMAYATLYKHISSPRVPNFL